MVEEEIMSTNQKKSWRIMTIALSLLVVASIVVMLNGGITSFATGNTILNEEEASTILLEYLNKLVGGGVELVEVTDLGELYEISVNYQDRIIPTYMTKDGKYYVAAIQEIK